MTPAFLAARTHHGGGMEQVNHASWCWRHAVKAVASNTDAAEYEFDSGYFYPRR
ncbi:MAG: hypothetical protein IPP41_12700 [Rhodocyclaceae bacterium]|nr:hypothetical protein [Rhodocyclaceae bacterium]